MVRLRQLTEKLQVSVSVLVRTKHELRSLVAVVKQLDHQAVMRASPGKCSCPEQQSTQGQEHLKENLALTYQV